MLRTFRAGSDPQRARTVTTFGAAFDVTLDDIVVESYFPADAGTAADLTARAR